MRTEAAQEIEKEQHSLKKEYFSNKLAIYSCTYCKWHFNEVVHHKIGTFLMESYAVWFLPIIENIAIALMNFVTKNWPFIIIPGHKWKEFSTMSRFWLKLKVYGRTVGNVSANGVHVDIASDHTRHLSTCCLTEYRTYRYTAHDISIRKCSTFNRFVTYSFFNLPHNKS